MAFILDANYDTDDDEFSDLGNIIGHQGLFHDIETKLICNRARVLHTTLGRFMQRDPLEYIDGLNVYPGYHLMHGLVDPYGLGVGHHWVPTQIQNQYSSWLSPEASGFFKKYTSGPLPSGYNKWDKAHAQYNQDVSEALNDYCKKNGINSTNKMTDKQAEAFGESLKSNPKTKGFIDNINKGAKKQQAFDADIDAEKTGKGKKALGALAALAGMAVIDLAGGIEAFGSNAGCQEWYQSTYDGLEKAKKGDASGCDAIFKSDAAKNSPFEKCSEALLNAGVGVSAMNFSGAADAMYTNCKKIAAAACPTKGDNP